MGMTSMGGGGQRITPNSLAMIDQLQGVARSPQSRAMPAPIENRSMGVDNFGRPVMADPTQRPPDYTRPQGIGERLTGILGGIGRGVNEYLADDENRARLVMALNSMRLQPDAGLSSAMGRQIETAQALRLMNSQGNRTAAAIRQIGGPKAEQYARAIEQNPSLAKEYFAAFIREAQEPSFRTFSGSQLNQAIPGGVYDEAKMYNAAVLPDGSIDTREKISAVGGSGVTINNPGDNTRIQTTVEELYSGVGERAQQARAQNVYLSTQERILEGGFETGPNAALKNQLRERLAAIGVFDVDVDAISNAQQFRAASNRLVAEELRLNKGPQTDFDAVFASTYYPSEQNTELVNKGLIREAKAQNQLSIAIGEVAGDRQYRYEGENNDIDRARRLQQYLTRADRFIVTNYDPNNPKNNRFLGFDEFYKRGKDRGKTTAQILEAWIVDVDAALRQFGFRQ